MADYDYIVVGSGSAGAIVAARLAENPEVSVLLLEAGGTDRTTFVRKPGMISLVQQVKQLKQKLDWGFSTAPQANLNDRRITFTRGKVVGGSSSVNGMIYLRGNQENYNDWAASGCEGWSFEDVLPFYKKLEDHQDGETEYHGAGGPIRISRHPSEELSPVSIAFMEAVSAVCGVPIRDDFNAETQHCAGILQMSCRDGIRSGTGEAYVQPSLLRPNFHLEMRALAQRVLIEKGSATGVEYVQSGKRVVAHARREVILSGGAIGSPQLLMLSGVGPADHLREHGIEVKQDLPGVGQNLHDHLLVPLVFRSRTSLHRGTAAHFFGGMIKEYMLGNSWFGRTVFEACAFIKSHPGAPIPDLQLHTLPWGYPDPNQDGPERAYVDTGHCLSVLPTLLYPKSRGEVRLTSAHAADAPHIDPAYLKEPEDMQLLLGAIRTCREICGRPELSEHLAEELVPGTERKTDQELREEIKLRAGTVYHPVGTCKMGVDETAVVDPELRVRGIEGLRVVDASIMPTITGSNTNAPSMMIGERAAALIQQG
ncbi:MAG: GMC family oxidoreductase N-terminal domain-containing protein [Deltaproteobacteria bacterium]|nr:GMC family oxidoreductase N-terminal domain-containing protein [Deltaproteobacteria bacterium]NND28209.1 choline dehydrogenase [Myxococcales bacterium]MBT8464263.1 GMC family oxidoreductase N-terminal domain-containing protein [Deltaproteobacteria bacterium]MBT8483446.1 GMC family oxidoreductase N-terminal domain-containing protein [Deltaproteobacteria bacterium]NNK07445.1 choline dehydrogenase [Myxococcales bacterium]